MQWGCGNGARHAVTIFGTEVTINITIEDSKRCNIMTVGDTEESVKGGIDETKKAYWLCPFRKAVWADVYMRSISANYIHTFIAFFGYFIFLI